MDPKIVKKFADCYDKALRPPEWSLDNNNYNFDEHSKHTIIYYNSSDNNSTTLQSVIELSTKREPTNIGMQRKYNNTSLQENFNYTKGAYDNFKESVNISAFTKTPFNVGKTTIELVNLNIISVIAPAFDSKHQPDNKYFSNAIGNKNIVKRFELIFDTIFYCALSKNLKNIYLTGFGTGFFGNYKENFGYGFANSFKKCEKLLADKNINLHYWTFNNSDIKIMFPGTNKVKTKFVNYNDLKSHFKTYSNEELNNSLFVNAWDPFSVIGNGNRGDNSWDGFLGRDSAMAVLSNLFINKNIKFEDTCDTLQQI